eukprot:46273-Rhodomonas_salina.1
MSCIAEEAQQQPIHGQQAVTFVFLASTQPARRSAVLTDGCGREGRAEAREGRRRQGANGNDGEGGGDQ